MAHDTLTRLIDASPGEQQSLLDDAGPTFLDIVFDAIMAVDPDLDSWQYRPMLAWYWHQPEYRLRIQAYQGMWSRERRDTFAALMQESRVVREALPEPLTGDAWQEAPQPRKWLVEGWLPAGELSLLTGPGSVGKSLFLLQLGAALACDRKVLNRNRGWLPGDSPGVAAPQLTPEPVPVVLAGWEDGKDEALRRRYRLKSFGGCPWAADESIDRHLHVLPMRGFGPTWAPLNHGHIATVGGLTETGRALRNYCERHGAGLLVLDTLAHALTLEENSRALVTLALEAWAGWAAESGCAVMITGHPSKASAGEAADYSGTTAWRGSVRVLWTLRRPDREDADGDTILELEGDPKQPERVARLTLNKNNYGLDDIGLNVVTVGHRAGWQIAGSRGKVPAGVDVGAANGKKANPYA